MQIPVFIQVIQRYDVYWCASMYICMHIEIYACIHISMHVYISQHIFGWRAVFIQALLREAYSIRVHSYFLFFFLCAFPYDWALRKWVDFNGLELFYCFTPGTVNGRFLFILFLYFKFFFCLSNILTAMGSN